jgi:hypothetical protein
MQNHSSVNTNQAEDFDANENNHNQNKHYNQIITKINQIIKGQKPYIRCILNDISNNQ